MSARGRFPSIEQWMLRRTCVTSWFHKVQRMIRPSPANRPALIENARWRRSFVMVSPDDSYGFCV